MGTWSLAHCIRQSGRKHFHGWLLQWEGCNLGVARTSSLRLTQVKKKFTRPHRAEIRNRQGSQLLLEMLENIGCVTLLSSRRAPARTHQREMRAESVFFFRDTKGKQGLVHGSCKTSKLWSCFKANPANASRLWCWKKSVTAEANVR